MVLLPGHDGEPLRPGCLSEPEVHIEHLGHLLGKFTG